MNFESIPTNLIAFVQNGTGQNDYFGIKKPPSPIAFKQAKLIIYS